MSPRSFVLLCGLAGWLLSGQKCHAQPSAGTSPMGYFIHPLLTPYDLTGRTVSESQRDKVHFIIVNGFDPLYVANLNGLADYVQSLGFRNTRLYYLYQMTSAEEDIRTTHAQDPEARIVLLGYSWGANAVRSIANQLNSEGIHLDSLIYLGGDTIKNKPHSLPTNCKHFVNIQGNGLVFLGYNIYFKGFDLDGADNHRVSCRHMLLPSRTETLAWVSEEVIRVARDVSMPKMPAAPGTPAGPGNLNMPVLPSPPPSPSIPNTPAARRHDARPRMQPVTDAIIPVSLKEPTGESWQMQTAPRPRYDDEGW